MIPVAIPLMCIGVLLAVGGGTVVVVTDCCLAYWKGGHVNVDVIDEENPQT